MGASTVVTIGGTTQPGIARQPQKPVAATVSKPAAALASTVYVCPMDPEVREKPGHVQSAVWRSTQTPVAATRTEWTCPMHPEMCAQPGSCPICGMALEPRTVTAAEEENPELRDMTRRFWWSVMLGVPLVAMAMLRMGPFTHATSPRLDAGSSSRWRLQSCSGRDGRSSSADGRR